MTTNWLAVIGLVLDTGGVALLARADVFNRKAQMLHQKSGGPNFVGQFEAALSDQNYEPTELEQTAQDHDSKVNAKRDWLDASCALWLLFAGFGLQLLAQFVRL